MVKGGGNIWNEESKELLEGLYEEYNRREHLHPDPVEAVYHYSGLVDREAAALASASFSYGQVKSIMKAVEKVLGYLPEPGRDLSRLSLRELQEMFKGFRYRFTSGEEAAHFLYRIGEIIKEYGSLYGCFKRYYNGSDGTLLPALTRFVGELRGDTASDCRTLLSCPEKGSACKRLNLFLRWMVRRDEIDPGGWPAELSRKLIIPLDTHMHRIGLEMGLTRRKQADMRTALEITESFRCINRDDPVRYDFALAHLSMRKESELRVFIRKWNQLNGKEKRPKGTQKNDQ